MLRKKSTQENGSNEEKRGLMGNQSSCRMQSFDIEDNTPKETHPLLIDKPKLTQNILACLIASTSAPSVPLNKAEKKNDDESKKSWPYKCDEKLLEKVINQTQSLFGVPDFVTSDSTVSFFKKRDVENRKTLISYLCDSIQHIQSGRGKYI